MRYRSRNVTRPVLAVSLLLAACGAGPSTSQLTAPPPPAAVGSPALHATPGRVEIMEAMNAVTPAVGACGDGRRGAVTMEIELAPDGTMRSAAARAPNPSATVAEIDLRGTPVEACIVAALRATRVAPFANERFRFGFPFILR